MKPTQVSQALRRIASGIDNSTNPNRSLVSRDLRRVLSAMEQEAAGATVIVHVHGDGTYTDVMTTDAVAPRSEFERIDLDNGDILYISNSVDIITKNLPNEQVSEALFNAGLIDLED